MAVLAASYLNKAKKQNQKLLEYKTQLFELTREKNYSITRSRELLRFIFLLIDLPEREKLKFDKTVHKLINMENIYEEMTPGEKRNYKHFADIVAYEIYGESIESMLKKKDATIDEKDATIDEKDATIDEKDATIDEKDAALIEKDVNFTKKLLLKGDFSVKEIAELVGISEYKVRKIRKEMKN